MCKSRLDVALGREQNVVGPEFQLGKATSSSELHTVGAIEVAVAAPAVNHHPLHAILLPHKKHTDALRRLLRHKFHNPAPLEPPQKGSPMAFALQCRIRVGHRKPQIIQASCRSRTWQRLRRAKRLDEISAVRAPQPLERGRDAPFRRQRDQRRIETCARSLAFHIVAARSANPERLKGSWAGRPDRRRAESLDRACDPTVNKALHTTRVLKAGGAITATSSAPKVVQGVGDVRT